MEDVQIKEPLAGFNCNICGSPMVEKNGKYREVLCLFSFRLSYTQTIVKEME